VTPSLRIAHHSNVPQVTAQVSRKVESLCAAALQNVFAHIVSPTAKEIFIQGITRDGRTFRHSDWAERLAGVMCSFRPGGAQPGSHLNYSPWCVPMVINGIKCVVVNRELRDYEPMAWDFVLNFARDNDLQVAEACLVPDAPKPADPPAR
jgi:hypothetical protein